MGMGMGMGMGIKDISISLCHSYLIGIVNSKNNFPNLISDCPMGFWAAAT